MENRVYGVLGISSIMANWNSVLNCHLAIPESSPQVQDYNRSY